MGLKLIDAPGRSRLICQPSSRTGENPPYGMIGGSRKRRHHSKPGPRLDPTRPVRKSAFTQPLKVAPRPPAPQPSGCQREITFVLGFQSRCANSVVRRLEQTHVETQCEDLMTSQGRRIAGCHLLLRGNRWMPISVNKALGAKDRCSPGGAVISAYLSAC